MHIVWTTLGTTVDRWGTTASPALSIPTTARPSPAPSARRPHRATPDALRRWPASPPSTGPTVTAFLSSKRDVLQDNVCGPTDTNGSTTGPGGDVRTRLAVRLHSPDRNRRHLWRSVPPVESVIPAPPRTFQHQPPTARLICGNGRQRPAQGRRNQPNAPPRARGDLRSPSAFSEDR